MDSGVPDKQPPILIHHQFIDKNKGRITRARVPGRQIAELSGFNFDVAALCRARQAATEFLQEDLHTVVGFRVGEFTQLMKPPAIV